jgi:hypothetical protein
MVESPPKMAMVAICEQIREETGVCRATVYNWLNKPEFQELLEIQTDNALRQWQPQVDKAMLNEALDGSVGAAQFLAQRGGRTVQGFKDKGMEDFLKRLPEEDRLALEHYEKHGDWPEEAPTILDEPETDAVM